MIETMYIDGKVKGILVTKKSSISSDTQKKEIKKLCEVFSLDEDKDIIVLPDSKLTFMIDVGGANADS